MAYSKIRKKPSRQVKNRFPSCLAANFTLPDWDENGLESLTFQSFSEKTYSLFIEVGLCSIRSWHLPASLSINKGYIFPYYKNKLGLDKLETY